MHNPPLHAMDYFGPALGAAVFVLILSPVREPARLRINGIFLAGALGVYLGGGLGPWELLFPLVLLCHKTRVRSSEWLGAAGGATGQEACQESCIEGAETGDGRGVVALRSNRESPAGGNLWVAERL